MFPASRIAALTQAARPTTTVSAMVGAPDGPTDASRHDGRASRAMAKISRPPPSVDPSAALNALIIAPSSRTSAIPLEMYSRDRSNSGPDEPASAAPPLADVPNPMAMIATVST